MTNPSILAIIPARGGSKGIPRKNIKNLAGKPLIAWTIEEAKKSKYITRLILSSDDDEIIKVAKEYGCEVPFKRPSELAQDQTSGMEPVLHALQECPGYDYVLLLQPTSPFRTVEDIDNCIEQVIKDDYSFCVSVTESAESPYWMYTVDFENIMNPLIKNPPATRQELNKTYSLNGALYIAKTTDFIKEKNFLNDATMPFIMPKNHSYDIDEPIDFKICNWLMREKVYENMQSRGMCSGNL